MAIKRNRENKKHPHYGFLVSWEPNQAHVKRESKSGQNDKLSEANEPKRAKRSDKVVNAKDVKKDIVRSLIVVGIVLTLEVVVYLAWNSNILP